MKPLVPLCLCLALPLSALATVSIEFQVGALRIPAGSLGVLVADTAGNGFTSPTDSAGTTLSVGERLGDDVIVAVFTSRLLPEWGSTPGFSEHLSALDYAALGVAEGQPLLLHIFPALSPGGAIRQGEPHLSLRDGTTTPNSTIGFELPRNGTAHLLAMIAAASGGPTDLGGIDMTSIPYSTGNGVFRRELAPDGRHVYFVHLSGTGPLSLEGIGGAGLTAELRAPDGQLVASSTGGDFLFERTLGSGFYQLTLTQAPGAGGTLPYSLTFANGILVVVPDVAVGRTPNRLVGSGVQNRLQIATILSKKARRVQGHATVANRGNRLSSLAMQAAKGSSLFRVAYFAPGNVTAALVAGTFRSPEMTSQTLPTAIRVQLSPNKKKLLKKKKGSKAKVLKRTFSASIRATATRGPASTDAGTIRVRTK